MQSSERNPVALDYIFHPRSIAVVGTANNPFNSGHMFLMSFHSFGFKGNIYPVHPEESEVEGLKCYPSVKDIPEPVDYAFSAIPARFTPQLVEDCVAKGVKVIAFFTAGFSESGEPGGVELEAELVRIARSSGTRLIGPNCVGVYCPSAGLSPSPDFSRQNGQLGLLSQSGGLTGYLVRALNTRGVYFSKAVSYGNACDINETDLLEYFAHDPETKIIAAYIEGVKDGRLFFKAVRESAQAKPVIVLKGGKTEQGAATAASHTSALAGSATAWDALVHQTGAIQVNTVDEMVDLACLFVHMPPPKGKRIGIVGLGGGASVLSADDCIRAGLFLPPLSREIEQRLRSFVPAAGNIFGNPLDTQAIRTGLEGFAETARIFGGFEQFDILLLHLAYDAILGTTWADSNLVVFRLHLQIWLDVLKEIKKPSAVVLHYATFPRTFQGMCEDREICAKAGLPIFYSMSEAANAISRFLHYHENKA